MAVTFEQLVDEYRTLREATDEARDRLRPHVVAKIRAGMPEAEAARVTGISRTTIRRWLGKPGE